MYEVSHRGDQLKVDLALWTCTCYHWQLTGIPCVHAFRCILEKNADPNDYVDAAYSRETYLHAYSQAINPMPGVNYWKKIDLPHPLPPVHKIMPGRPNLKKRKKEKGKRLNKKQRRLRWQSANAAIVVKWDTIKGDAKLQQFQQIQKKLGGLLALHNGQ
ncbi:uncharacterized protein LOC125498005 [Beta vulgaris subsp. vulgaris]|uniref:uncharacterized protein LOC125498005 n=1 Tax=Beta vulgaris subsp. vulgaris TaxID=3555 RepID=UPI002547CA01|nr:uncharacterized protein LOC125498005 [Beta vulgaris subsp. vulgaris]